jgi:hypothetical protein
VHKYLLVQYCYVYLAVYSTTRVCDMQYGPLCFVQSSLQQLSYCTVQYSTPHPLLPDFISHPMHLDGSAVPIPRLTAITRRYHSQLLARPVTLGREETTAATVVTGTEQLQGSKGIWEEEDGWGWSTPESGWTCNAGARQTTHTMLHWLHWLQQLNCTIVYVRRCQVLILILLPRILVHRVCSTMLLRCIRHQVGLTAGVAFNLAIQYLPCFTFNRLQFLQLTALPKRGHPVLILGQELKTARSEM